MKHFWLIILFIFTSLSCNSRKSNTSIYDFVPENSEIILNINAIETLKSNVKNNDLISELMASDIETHLSRKLGFLEFMSTTKPMVLSFIKDENDSLQFTLATKNVSNLFDIESLPNHKEESITFDKLKARKFTYKNEVTYAAIKDSVVVVASTLELLKNLWAKKIKNKKAISAFSTIDKEKPLSVIINSHQSNAIKTVFHSETLPFKDFTDFTTFDAEVSQDQIILSGVTQAKDSTARLIDIFKNTTPHENQLAEIAPNNCEGFLSFTFDDFSVFNTQLKAFRKTQDSVITTTLLDNIVEVGIIHQPNSKAIVLNSIDIVSTKEALISEQSREETYRQIEIFNFSTPELFAEIFQPLITYDQAKYYCIIEQFVVFGDSKESLENIIANYQNETTLSSRDYYRSISEHLSTDASILQISKPEVLKNVLETNLNSAIDASLKNYKISALQFIYDTDYAHLNAIIKKDKGRIESNAVTEVLNIKLDVKLLNDPQFVINHRTKQKEIVVQDINNKLYLISNTGNILWKKQLNGPILGRIEQIDIYKNGRLQLAFATPHRVYLIARNGKDVDGYPLLFNDKITQPLSVFDYDKKKNYRLFVTQGKQVLLYDGKGKTVQGFKFSSAQGIINSQPQHLRIASKDYIIIKTDETLHILSRRGKTRVSPKTSLAFSNQPVYQYDDGFATTTQDGRLIQIDDNGKVTTSTLLGQDTNLVTTSKTLVAQNDNKLKIKNNVLELNFGSYTAPKLFYIDNKIYVSLTELQSQKVLLYDSQAKLLPNFPVYGNASIDLDNIDSDPALEFVTKGDSNTILVYKIN